MVTVAVAAVWWWLGTPVRMPPSPLGAGEKLYCVSYAPFRGQQSPLDPSIRVTAAQIDDDLARLSRVTDCVRTYSTRNGIDQVPEIAARHGMKVIQGIWLGGNHTAWERDIAVGVGLAQRFPDVIRAVVAGNEVLLRGEMTANDLAATIRRIKAQISQPITYADVWEFWLRYREIYAAVDFVTIHILPYWEDFPIPARQAATHVESIRRRIAQAFPDKEILLGETGWPSAGRMREGALPSPANQARVLHDVLNIAKREGYHANLIEAFDQPWKRRLEGTVGGHWGLFDAKSRTAKFAWGEPVSNHPAWRLQAIGGVALAVLVFAAAFMARDRERPDPPPGMWVGVASMALGSGILTGWAIENVPLESLTAGDWLRSLTMVALCVVAPLLGAAALMRQNAIPGFAVLLGAAAERPLTPWVRALGFAWIVLCVIAVQVALGLVFDPRYKDFPFAPLTGAAIPFVVLACMVPVARARGLAETAFAVLLAGCAVYIALNESFANWQALWLVAVFLTLAVILMWRRGGPAPA